MLKLLLFSAPLLFASITLCAEADPNFAQAELAEGEFTASTSGTYRIGKLFQAGSISKYTCTLAVLRLADRSVLDLDTAVAAYLPKQDAEWTEKVSLRQLMANRSGIPDGLTQLIETDMAAALEDRPVERALNEYVQGPPQFEPGSEYSYDLVNWIAVQAVLQAVTQEPLGELLRKEIFQPAGLGGTALFGPQQISRLQSAAGDEVAPPGYLACAGGLVSTPQDLIALLRFANQGGLSQRSLSDLRTITTPEENYTLGGRVERRGDRLLDWKTGSNGDYKSLVVYDPAKDIGFAAMTASGDWDAINAARENWIERTAR